MKWDLRELKAARAYQLMVAAIVPRPIAWVSTQSAKGTNNLAPFSFFNGVTAEPPTLLFCPVNDREGKKKDTIRNIEETGEFVVNVVNSKLCEQMVATAATFEYGVSEFEACGVSSTTSEVIAPLRVSEAPVSFECRLRQVVQVGEGPLGANIVIGDILLMHVVDECLDENQNILSNKLDLVGRMGSNDYVSTSAIFEVIRPK